MFPPHHTLLRHLVVGTILLTYTSCSTPQVDPVRNGGFKPDLDEQTLWDGAAKVDASVEERGLLYRDDALQHYLEGVSARLLPHLGAADAQVRIRVFKSPLINAAAMANGTVYLFMGILARTENEAQLATVLGHELVHFLGRHTLRDRRMQQSQVQRAKVLFTTFALTGLLIVGVPLMEHAFQAQINGYSRDLEREADMRSLQAMAAAGYDPREAPKIFVQFQEEEEEAGVEEPYVYASHPRLAERIESYNAYLAQVGGRGAETAMPVSTDAFEDAVSQLLIDTAESDLDLHRVERARRSIERHLAHRPQSARGYFALGELQRRSAEATDKGVAARAAYEEAIRLDPGYGSAHREAGLLQREAGQLTAAQAELTRYLELVPDAPDRAIIQSYIDELRAGGALGGVR